MDAVSRMNLLAFIQDFNLRRPDGVTSFNAVIIFRHDNNERIIETEVQVITSGNVEAIYIMGPEINYAGLPDTFTSEKEKFFYRTNKCLQITNEKESDNFTVSIFPK
jgi:hypothetical protein